MAIYKANGAANSSRLDFYKRKRYTPRVMLDNTQKEKTKMKLVLLVIAFAIAALNDGVWLRLEQQPAPVKVKAAAVVRPEAPKPAIAGVVEEPKAAPAVAPEAKPAPQAAVEIPATVYCVSHGNLKPVHIGNARIGYQLAGQLGWQSGQWQALLELWACESGWDNTAQNPYSTAYGMAQFLDQTWAQYGCSKTSDPAEQIRCGLRYVQQRYGTPAAALAHHHANNWY